jgi:uncharacterized protein YcfJ
LTLVRNKSSAAVNSNLILEEEANYKGAKVVSGNSISENIEERKEQGKWVANQQTRPVAASR